MAIGQWFCVAITWWIQYWRAAAMIKHHTWVWRNRRSYALYVHVVLLKLCLTRAALYEQPAFMCACDLNAVKQLSTIDTLCLYYFTWRARHPYVRASPYMCSFLFFFSSSPSSVRWRAQGYHSNWFRLNYVYHNQLQIVINKCGPQRYVVWQIRACYIKHNNGIHALIYDRCAKNNSSACGFSTHERACEFHVFCLC